MLSLVDSDGVDALMLTALVGSHSSRRLVSPEDTFHFTLFTRRTPSGPTAASIGTAACCQRRLGAKTKELEQLCVVTNGAAVARPLT